MQITIACMRKESFARTTFSVCLKLPLVINAVCCTPRYTTCVWCLMSANSFHTYFNRTMFETEGREEKKEKENSAY